MIIFKKAKRDASTNCSWKRWIAGALSCVAVVCGICGTFNGASANETSSLYRLVWDAPSTDWNGTIPLGNGEVGLNLWFDAKTATLKMLISRTDAWDDFGRLVKIGGVDIAVKDANFSGFSDKNSPESAPFLQILDVEKGLATIAFGPEGEEIRLKIWVEPSRPNIVVEIESDAEIAPVASLNLWRGEEREIIKKAEVSDLFWGSGEVAVYPDTVLPADATKSQNRIGWYHRNVKTSFFDEIGAAQGLNDFPGRVDPLENLTFGALLSCDAPVWKSETTLAAAPGKSRRFEITTHTAQTAQLNDWLVAVRQLADEANAAPIDARRDANLAYWRDFSERSWIRFSPNKAAIAELSDAERAEVEAETIDVDRAYALQRFVFACEGRGAFPIKYNGGLFTVPTPGGAGGPDYRRWGPGYWFQNTRLPYYSATASGDFEIMKPFFDMYCGLVPLYKYRSQKYFGYDDAVFFSECVYFWGDVFPETYGATPWDKRDDKLQSSGYHKWEWVGGLEIVWLALNYYEYTQDDEFLNKKLIPTANAVLRFFDSFYRVDAATGKLKMSPAQALETWWSCDNPAPEIAGIRGVIGRLQALPNAKTTAADREYWAELLARTPEVPTRIDDTTGATMLAPAARFAQLSNIETPELYPVFPFRLFSFEKPNADWARLALERRINKNATGWAQDDLFFAYLGDSENARQNLVVRSRAKNAAQRFPAFWGPNWDWTPDQCHAGVLVTTAQSLVLQTDGDAIYLAPALPKNWDVEFKLWAPGQTTLEGKIVDGKVAELNVEPRERRDDVIIPTSYVD